MKTCAVIYNPISGKKVNFSAMPQFEKMLAKYGYESKIIYTKYKGHATESVRDDEARQLQDAMIDSLNEIVNFNDSTFLEDKNDKKKKPKVGSSTKFDDLKDLPFAFGTLGAVLANTLDKKDKDEKKDGLNLKYVDERLLSTPSVALMHVKKEINYMMQQSFIQTLNKICRLLS